MPHKADRSFFDHKKPWSKRKDQILSYYLTPYLPKVARLARPIALVDGFAGPGAYGDGSLGSPLLLCRRVQDARGLNVPVSIICIEEDDELHARLVTHLKDFPFASARHGTFLEHLPEVETLAKTHTVFLYVDPYAIEGLRFVAMDRVFQHLRHGASIEVLLNFGAASFVRRGLAARAMPPPPADQDEGEDMTSDPPSVVRLNEAIGGDWWQQIIDSGNEFPEQVKQVAEGLGIRLSQRFKEVCEHAVKAKWTDKVAKYSLIFASRSDHALILMNEATIKSRNQLADSAKPDTPTLFETRPMDLVPDAAELPAMVLAAATKPMMRQKLIAAVVRNNFCRYSESQIKGVIRDHLQTGNLTKDPEAPLNDKTVIRRARS
jgi:three-Cys-motif partner protein